MNLANQEADLSSSVVQPDEIPVSDAEGRDLSELGDEVIMAVTSPSDSD